MISEVSEISEVAEVAFRKFLEMTTDHKSGIVNYINMLLEYAVSA
jgi:hypothetical protein